MKPPVGSSLSIFRGALAWRHGLAGIMPLVMLLLVWSVFAAISPKFREPSATIHILLSASSAGIVAVGMSFVLLVAGIDLSVGSIMLLAGAIAGRAMIAGAPPWMMLIAMVLMGLAWGCVNGTLIAWLGMTPFIVTLATLFAGRGLGLWVTETRPLNLPDEVRQWVATRLLGLPLPVIAMIVVVVAAYVLLQHTPAGRQLYAVGHDAAAARKAGLPVRRLTLLAYVLCSGCAAGGGAVTLLQLGAVSPTLGQGRELEAIAAAVLGGVSLFGGRGGPLGAAFGAIMIQTIFNGLTTIDADPSLSIAVDPYIYPVITSGVIFSAVLADSLRQHRTGRPRRVAAADDASAAAIVASEQLEDSQ